MRVTYLCTIPGRLRIGAASFARGVFDTTDLKLQDKIENSAYFRSGAIRIIPNLDELKPPVVIPKIEVDEFGAPIENKPLQYTATQLINMRVADLKTVASMLGIDPEQAGTKLRRAIRQQLGV